MEFMRVLEIWEFWDRWSIWTRNLFSVGDSMGLGRDGETVWVCKIQGTHVHLNGIRTKSMRFGVPMYIWMEFVPILREPLVYNQMKLMPSLGYLGSPSIYVWMKFMQLSEI